ncbi:enoyl-CoA hydratase [Neoconidiobolus thromboides FSU 785]|nr:enoyl-CoA hydratase [Neoconidiobolus thromboides FSU 785]
MIYSYILVETIENIGLIKLNRPKALNALSRGLISELNLALNNFELQDDIGCIVITGNEKVFAAGADINEMKDLNFNSAYKMDLFGEWFKIANIRKPLIAAVNGYALGGGCELAMMCDIIYAGEKAKFGQPEIKIGIIPGSGGTQRLVQAVGKSKAMEIILTGNWNLSAKEAEQFGLISKVFPVNEVLNEAIKTAKMIASGPKLATQIAKEAVNNAFEMPLNSGLLMERRLIQACFGTKDQKEGMEAFIEKRAAKFQAKL